MGPPTGGAVGETISEPTLYYWWLENHRDAAGMWGTKMDLAGVDKTLQTSTSPADAWPANVRFYTEGTIAWDHLPCVAGWTLVSARVKRILEELDGEAVECLPVQVFRLETGEELPGYYLLHVLREVSAFDREHGTYSIYENGDLGVIMTALRKEAVEGLHIFRLAEADTWIYVSRVVVKRLKWIRATGFVWSPVCAYP